MGQKFLGLRTICISTSCRPYRMYWSFQEYIHSTTRQSLVNYLAQRGPETPIHWHNTQTQGILIVFDTYELSNMYKKDCREILSLNKEIRPWNKIILPLS